MRTMNKIVALALVLAMAFSMMASAASFKDQATINADLMDEINLLVALGVYSEQGTGAGYFEPNGTITRAQAAKIIYVLKNKGVDNGATSWTGLNIFTDVEAGAWYEGYVNYCASTGILAGVGEGKYNPNGTLTGVELAKMLLVLIGYKADVEGYTGANWDANILADAEAAGFFVDYELPVRGIITREWSAQMIVNAINAIKVRYADGELVEMYNDNVPVTFKAQDLGLNEVSDVLIATPNIKLVPNGSAANNENGKTKTSAIGSFSNNIPFEYDANSELLGSKVTVLFKGETLKTATKVYGVTAHVENVITDTTVDAVEYDADNFEAKVYFYEDYALVSSNMDVEAFFDANDGRAIKMIDRDNDGEIDIIMTNSVAYGVVDYINPANHTFRATNTDPSDVMDITGDATARKEAWEKINFVDTVVEGDVIKVTKDFTSGKEITVVEKLDVVTGAISKIASDVITLDGAQYMVSTNNINSLTITSVNKTAKDYFVDGKYIVHTANIENDDVKNTNVAYVIKKSLNNQKDEWNNDVMKVDVLKNDGTRETLSYVADSKVNNDVNFANVQKDRLYKYEMKDGKISLSELTGTGIVGETQGIANIGTTKAFDKSEGKFKVAVTEGETTTNKTYLVNEETYFFVIDSANSKYAVATAAEIKGDMAYLNSRIAVSTEGMPYLYFAVLGGEIPGAESTSVTRAIAGGTISEELNDSNETIYKLEVTKIDGTVVTLEAKTNVFENKTNKFVDYKIGTNGYVETFNVTTFANTYHAAVLKNFSDTGILLGDDTYLDLADDVKIYFVDAYKNSNEEDRIIVSEGSSLVKSTEPTEGNFAQSIIYKYNATDAEVTEIICEVQGEEIVEGLYNGFAE